MLQGKLCTIAHAAMATDDVVYNRLVLFIRIMSSCCSRYRLKCAHALYLFLCTQIRAITICGVSFSPHYLHTTLIWVQTDLIAFIHVHCVSIIFASWTLFLMAVRSHKHTRAFQNSFAHKPKQTYCFIMVSEIIWINKYIVNSARWLIECANNTRRRERATAHSIALFNICRMCVDFVHYNRILNIPQ